MQTIEFPVRPTIPWEAIAMVVLAIAALVALLMTLLNS